MNKDEHDAVRARAMKHTMVIMKLGSHIDGIISCIVGLLLSMNTIEAMGEMSAFRTLTYAFGLSVAFGGATYLIARCFNAGALIMLIIVSTLTNLVYSFFMAKLAITRLMKFLFGKE